MNLIEIYEANKELDMIFAEKYKKETSDILVKNMVELLVEFGELANEIKSFKYWSDSPVSKDKLLKEFADSLMMILFFANTLDMTLKEKALTPIEMNLNKQLLYLLQLGANLQDNYTKEHVGELLINLMHLKELLNLTDEEVESVTLNTIKDINKKIER